MLTSFTSKYALLIAATGGLLASQQALADCAPDNPADGATVTCSDADPDGFDFENADDIEMTVNTGATISGAPGNAEAIKLGGSANITVQSGGTIISATNDAVQTEADLVLRNSGTIQSDDKDGINAQEDASVTITSTGVVLAKDAGVQGEARLTVTNLGTITTTGDAAGKKSSGIRATNRLTAVNFGMISAAYEGITAENRATIVNSGTITGIDDAIKAGSNTAITNSGVIENVGTPATDPQDAIDIDSGEINNLQSGVIRSTRDAAIDFDKGNGSGTIINQGTIVGTIGVETDAENTGKQTIVNNGLIHGTAGVSLNLRGGKDTVTLNEGGRFVGNVNLGKGRDVFTVGSGSFGNFANKFITNGGDGANDTLSFSAFSILNERNVTRVGQGGIYDISLSSGTSNVVIRFTGFEFFSFKGITISFAQLMEPTNRK
ncbi:MAG: hypothetical protein ACR2PF_14050 [Rhizobiaceae bacterium]